MQELVIIEEWTENASSFIVSLLRSAIVRFCLHRGLSLFIHGKILDFLPGYLFQALR